MKGFTRTTLAAMLIATGVLSAPSQGAPPALTALASAADAKVSPSVKSELTGTWTLDYADVIHPDGSRGHDYGEKPIGILIIDASGNYSQQIFDTARPKFAAAEKAKGTEEEYKAATIGASSHFGTIAVDTATHIITFNLVGSTYPNQEGSTRKIPYTLSNGLLVNKSPARANGDVPVTEWKRLP